jgi:hypothetical protein
MNIMGNILKQVKPQRLLISHSRLVTSLPDHWKWGLFYWLISRGILFGWGCLLWVLNIIPLAHAQSYYFNIKPILNGIAAPFIGVWLRWDAINYLRIAQFGYYEKDLTAFFPLYPLLGRSFGWVTGGNYLISLMTLSNLEFLITLVILFRLIQENNSKILAHRTLIVLLAFPGAFFFYSAYPHSQLLLFAVLICLFAQKKMWVNCIIVGILAGLTHSTASTLAVLISAYSLPIWWQNRYWKNFHLLLVPLSPLLGVGIFLAWRISKGYPDFSALQFELWGKHVIPPWQIITMSFSNISVTSLFTWIDLIIFLACLGYLPYIWKNISKQYALFLGALVVSLSIIACNTEPLPSFIRYILIGFPLFIAIAQSIRKLFTPFIVILLCFQLLLCGAFLMWLWVA